MDASETDALLGDKLSPASSSNTGSNRRVRISLVTSDMDDDRGPGDIELPEATRAMSSTSASSSGGDVEEPEASIADVEHDDVKDDSGEKEQANQNTYEELAVRDDDDDDEEEEEGLVASSPAHLTHRRSVDLTKPRISTSTATTPLLRPQPPPPQYYQTGDLAVGIQRTHSFPDDLYSGARFARFEIEETLRQKQGTSILDWLHAKRQQLQQQKGALQKPTANDEHDDDKKRKAQHLESYDYDFFESRVNMQADHEQTEETIRALNIGRWVMTFSIGLCTALVACFVETFTKIFSTFRTTTMEQYVLRELKGELPFGAGFAIYAGVSVGFVSIAAYMVAILCPVAGGSGISEIKATLNGIKIHRVVRFKTLFCKAFGILFSVAGGLAVGKEGPMIHSGAVIGAGLSQGKSSSFGIDTSWTKFKGFRNDKEKRDFISCGAAAGVAAAFGAPIGGVLFALEEGASFWHQNLTWRTFFCAMVSAFVFNFFISVMETDSIANETGNASSFEQRVFFGTLGTQTGTFSFGPFIGGKSYEILDLLLFITMGMLGGLFGAAFNQANKHLTLWRQRRITNRWVKFVEALFIALCMAAASFWLPYYFGECRALGGPYQESLVTLYCPEGHYNDLASLFTVTYSTSIKQLLHFTGDASFSPMSLLIFFSVFYIFACWTYGISVPSGLFVPSLLAGAAFGRICVMAIHWLGFPVGAQDGMFALIGAASMLGGMARMTISLTVIILECTGVIEWGLPIMVALMAARWVGNSFNEGLYDVHIHLKHLPFLEFDPPFYARFLRVENIMSTPPVTVNQIAKVGEIYDILRECNHGGFPVVIPGKPREGESASDARQRLRRRNKFAGLIYRRHLCVLLQRKDFFVEKPLPFTRRPAGDTTLLYNDQYALSYRDLESNYPRYPTIQEIKLDDDERDLWMDLTPYMNTTPHTVQDQTPVPRAFRLFRSLGLRHLVRSFLSSSCSHAGSTHSLSLYVLQVVLNRNNEVRGMISRKDLTPAHLKFCLETLSETEKMRIQGYFTRGRSGSERFEDVEKTLLNIVDNS
jgi:chloride channel 7